MPPTVRNKFTQIFDTLQYPLNENSAVENRRNLIDKPRRGPVRNWCQQPPLVLNLHGLSLIHI